MSPAIAQAAARVASRRAFSAVSALRSAPSVLEAPSLKSLPAAVKPQAGDWGKQFKRVGTIAFYFVPTAAGVLTWPFAAQWLFDGRVGSI
ncbi:hypothetical protein S40293_07297 [Stachybotrys chartarum IBT 40293]|nr:hypothetical protein S40293_07297 [Stachybotrys chartarum IBT 40293]KFA74601.1 hypothetical protein S40288_05816 [Stachybotrys chartarum IBT 40288]